jgi:hypothetical protein
VVKLKSERKLNMNIVPEHKAIRRDHLAERAESVLHVIPGTLSSPTAKFGY